MVKSTFINIFTRCTQPTVDPSIHWAAIIIIVILNYTLMKILRLFLKFNLIFFFIYITFIPHLKITSMENMWADEIVLTSLLHSHILYFFLKLHSIFLIFCTLLLLLLWLTNVNFNVWTNKIVLTFLLNTQ